jgi:glutamate carboxypeptidase
VNTSTPEAVEQYFPHVLGDFVTDERPLNLLRELVEIESPTGHSVGLRAVASRVADQLEPLGGEPRFLGDHLRVELPGEPPPLLLLGHVDTVWGVGTLEDMPFRIENGRAYGPGAYDMKAGLVVLLEAVRAAGERRRALRVFLTADEEIGSLTGRPLIEEAAQDVAAALVLEPPTPRGNLKTARKGLGRFRLVVRGRAAHAGTHLDEGASAVEELAHQILLLKGVSDPRHGISVNVGVVRGGVRENVVADHAEAWIDVRVTHAADVPKVQAALEALSPKISGTSLELEGGFTRPPLERSPGAARLFAKAREHGAKLGLDLHESSSGGGSDGNLVGALGVPVLDGLGAEGGGAHARDEHVLLESLPVRALLLSQLLIEPGL